ARYHRENRPGPAARNPMRLPQLSLLALLLVPAPVRPADPPRYEYRRDHDPNGTGKFYMGREIALVMGHEAAGWLDRPEREKEEHPTRLIEILKPKKEEVVA